MAGLAARRLADMTTLAFRAAAISTTIASQAIDLRGGSSRLGPELRGAHDRVRRIIPELPSGYSPPIDLEPLYCALREGLLSRGGAGNDGKEDGAAFEAPPARAPPTPTRSRL